VIYDTHATAGNFSVSAERPVAWPAQERRRSGGQDEPIHGYPATGVYHKPHREFWEYPRRAPGRGERALFESCCASSQRRWLLASNLGPPIEKHAGVVVPWNCEPGDFTVVFLRTTVSFVIRP
jgi:hypothetical protein